VIKYVVALFVGLVSFLNIASGSRRAKTEKLQLGHDGDPTLPPAEESALAHNIASERVFIEPLERR
jgi:hypothetical protein